MTRLFSCFLAAVLLTALTAAQAHDAWIEARDGGYVVLFGHTATGEPYVPSKVLQLKAIDAKGAPVELRRQDEAQGVRATAAKPPALIMVHFDNGYWSKTADNQPARNLPKNEVPGAVSAVHAVKYGKTMLAWSTAVTQPQGQYLELVPQSAEAPKVGQTLPVLVLQDKKPLAGARLVRGDHGKETVIEADAQGRALVPVVAGAQTWSVSRRFPLVSDARADTESLTANLVFTAR